MAMRQRVRRKQEAVRDAFEGEASARTRIASPAVHASLLANPWPGARRHGRPASRPWSTFLLVLVPSHRVQHTEPFQARPRLLCSNGGRRLTSRGRRSCLAGKSRQGRSLDAGLPG